MTTSTGIAQPAAALRADLLAADYTVEGLDRLLGAHGAAALHREQFAAVRWQLDHLAASPLATLIRLFMLGDEVPADQVDVALASGAAGLRTLGLAEPGSAPDRVRAALDLRPYAEDGAPPWWVVSDLGEQVTGRPLTPDYVLGVGQASLTLAAVTPRPRVARALDLGVGCGVQSLHLTQHCEEVVATDLSERALRLAQLSFALSGVEVECRTGDLLAPVAGEQFDLIVSNPPFVITPRDAGVPTFTYRDGGRAGDEIVRTLVTNVGSHLSPGGVFVALGNWEVRASDGVDDWTASLTEWLDHARDDLGNPLDAWVIQRELSDPTAYAGLWSRDGGADQASRDGFVRAWLDDFAAREVSAIGMGVIMLRRPGPGTRAVRRLEHRDEPLPDDLGAHLLACLSAHDRLGDPIRDPSGDARLQRAADVVEVRTHEPGQDEPVAIQLVQGAGFGRRHQVDTATAAFVGACDGDLSVAQLGSAIAALLEADAAEVVAGLAAAVPGLTLDGFLAPASG